jgi:hypothetical protein
VSRKDRRRSDCQRANSGFEGASPMTDECPFCGEPSEEQRLAVVSVDNTEYYGTLWRCLKCGVISDEMGNEVSP